MNKMSSEGTDENRPIVTYRSSTSLIPHQPERSVLVGSVNGQSVGEGPGRLYSTVDGPVDDKVAKDAQMRKLVYNMYRGLLNTKHERANAIVESAPEGNISADEGVSHRVKSMMRQQKDLAEVKMNYGPPPPPPPPPFATGAPPVILPSEVAAAAAAAAAASRTPTAAPPCPAINLPPIALCGAMMKDKRPFTYTPGGLNLSEIKSPRMQRRLQRNASLEGVPVSPLAQPPKSAQAQGGGSPAISHRGMIQVLPMPGMAMCVPQQPVPQQQRKESKESTKSRRNSCGPAPPPPPFAISSGSSNEPCETPNTTPATTPAINSFSPPSTPGTSSSPSITAIMPAPIPVLNRLQGEPMGYSSSPQSPPTTLQPKLATEIGPSPPMPGAPPPPPPPGGVSSKKIPLSEVGVPVYIPALAKHLSNVNPTSSSLANSIKVHHSFSTSDVAPDSTSEMTESSSPMSHEDHRSSSHKRESSSREYETSFSESEIERLVGDESSSDASKPSQNILKNIEEEVLKTKEILEQDTKLLEPQQVIGRETNVTDGRQFNDNYIQQPQHKINHLQNKTPDGIYSQVAKAPAQEISFVPPQEAMPNFQETKEVIPTVQVKNNMSQPYITLENVPKGPPVERPDLSIRPIHPIVPLNSTVVKAEPLIMKPEPLIIKPEPLIIKPEPRIVMQDIPIIIPESPFVRPVPNVVRSTTNLPSPPIVAPKPSSLTMGARMVTPPTVGLKPSPIITDNKIISSPCTMDPKPYISSNAKMVPQPQPVLGPRPTSAATNDRFMRQVSLPAQPPPTPPEATIEEATSIPLPNISPTSGLAKGPMPWMCAPKKENSPVPEFLAQARKNQNKYQRQRSLPRQEHKGSNNELSTTLNGIQYSQPVVPLDISSPIKGHQDGIAQQDSTSQFKTHQKQASQFTEQAVSQHQDQMIQQSTMTKMQQPMGTGQQIPLSQQQQNNIVQHQQCPVIHPQQQTLPQYQKQPVSPSKPQVMHQLQQQPISNQQQNPRTNLQQSQHQPIAQPQYQSIPQPQYQSIPQSQQEHSSQQQRYQMSQSQHQMSQQHQYHQPPQSQQHQMVQPQQHHMPQQQPHQMAQSQQHQMPQQQPHQMPQSQQRQMPQPQQNQMPQPQQRQMPQPQQNQMPQPQQRQMPQTQRQMPQTQQRQVPQPQQHPNQMPQQQQQYQNSESQPQLHQAPHAQHYQPNHPQQSLPQAQQYLLSQPAKTTSPPQSRFMQQQMNNKTAPQQNSRPRERIIPIMLEEASVCVQNSQSVAFQQNSQQQQQQQWSQSNGGPLSPSMEVVFNPFDNQIQTSSTAIEALQQMQQNLAQLNSGLQTAQHQPTTTGSQIQPGSGNQALQSKGFRVIQSAYDNQANNEPLLMNQPPVEPKKYTGGNIPSRSFRMLQAMTDNDKGPGPGESDL